jgi:hypothetical protein
MKAGLLGAIAGLGEGIQDVGTSLMKRREQALEDARELAKEQARQAQRQSERQEDREFKVDMFKASQGALDERAAANQAAVGARQEAGFRHQETMVETRARQAKDLATYKANLSRLNSQAATDYKHKLSQGDVKGIKPGRVRAKDGFVEVLGVRKDGKAFPTGQWVVPNFFQTPTQNFGKAGGEDDEGSLLLDDEEEDQ